MEKKSFAVGLLFIFFLFLGNSLFLTSALAAEMEVPEHGVQIRVYADRGFVVGGRKGMFLQIYGIHIEEDGSEKVVWRKSLGEIGGLKGVVGPYRYAYLDNYVYLRLYESREYIKLNRNTGEILDKLNENDEELAVLKDKWISFKVRIRPDLTDIERSEPQIFDFNIIEQKSLFPDKRQEEK